ncbi:hypothetical protein OIO90_005032 [Microbotryomycetes sp. JL221]|nr:hypothetical protein OIO90_005032 [Microbotryomycetes sp. JL221]
MGQPSPAWYDEQLLIKCKQLLEAAMRPEQQAQSHRRHNRRNTGASVISFERFVEALDPEWSINVAAFEAIVHETIVRLDSKKRSSTNAASRVQQRSQQQTPHDNSTILPNGSHTRARRDQASLSAFAPTPRTSVEDSLDHIQPGSREAARHWHSQTARNTASTSESSSSGSAANDTWLVNESGIDDVLDDQRTAALMDLAPARPIAVPSWLRSPEPSTTMTRPTADRLAWTTRRRRPSDDQLVSVEIVQPDGSVVALPSSTTSANSTLLSEPPATGSSRLSELVTCIQVWDTLFDQVFPGSTVTNFSQLVAHINASGRLPHRFLADDYNAFVIELRELDQDLARRVERATSTPVTQTAAPRTVATSGNNLRQIIGSEPSEWESYAAAVRGRSRAQVQAEQGLTYAQSSRLRNNLLQRLGAPGNRTDSDRVPSRSARGRMNELEDAASGSVSDAEDSTNVTTRAATETPSSSIARSPVQEGIDSASFECVGVLPAASNEGLDRPATSADIAEAAARVRRRIAPLPRSSRARPSVPQT